MQKQQIKATMVVLLIVFGLLALGDRDISLPNLPVNPGGVTQMTWVYDDDMGLPHVWMAPLLTKISNETEIATGMFDVSSVNVDGDIPEQYKIASAAGKTKGLPQLVVQKGEVVSQVIRPSGYEDVARIAGVTYDPEED